MTHVDSLVFRQRVNRVLLPKRLNIRKDGRGDWQVYNILSGATVREFQTIVELAKAYNLISKWETI